MTTQPMSDEKLNEIRARVEAAPPGPWTAEPGYPQAFHNGGENYLGEFYQDMDEPKTLATFVVRARADIPALLAEVDRLRKALTTAADRIEGSNPDRGYEFSEGVDWAVAELRGLAGEER